MNIRKTAYNRFRNSINRDMKKSKKDYYSNMNKTWRGIKELVDTKNNLSTNITQLKANNSTPTIPSLTASNLLCLT